MRTKKDLIFKISEIILFVLMFVTLFVPNFMIKGLNDQYNSFHAAGYPIFDHGKVTYFYVVSIINLITILCIVCGLVIEIFRLFKKFAQYEKGFSISLILMLAYIAIFTLTKTSFTHIANESLETTARSASYGYILLSGAYVCIALAIVCLIVTIADYITNDKK